MAFPFVYTMSVLGGGQEREVSSVCQTLELYIKQCKHFFLLIK